MLKNMKVGTKLIAVLVAPVLVLVILASIGVSQRLDTATQAKRVEELAQMAAADANLANEIQREAVYSAAYMASGGKTWTDELATQRKATDTARTPTTPLSSASTRARTPTSSRRPSPRWPTGSTSSTPSGARSTASRPRPPRRSSSSSIPPRAPPARWPA